MSVAQYVFHFQYISIFLLLRSQWAIIYAHIDVRLIAFGCRLWHTNAGQALIK